MKKNIIIIGAIILLLILGILLMVSVKKSDYDWESDGILLMQHETEGFFGCFGCGKLKCIDPIVEMKLVSETPKRYCSADLKVIEG